MYQSVRDMFHDFTGKFEGRDVPFMYLDHRTDKDGNQIECMVTIGNGNLIDPVSEAIGEPFKKWDGSLASPEEITTAWLTVKSRQDLAVQGGLAFAHVTDLVLDESAMLNLLWRRLDANEAILSRCFSNWGRLPADAQLAVHSMAWAMGPHFPLKFPKFSLAIMRSDFRTAADECNISNLSKRNGRNQADFQLLLNAAAVAADPCADRSQLVFQI